MQDRVRSNNGKSSTIKCPSSYSPADFATFLSNLKAGTVFVDVSPNNTSGADKGVEVVGTPLNKANMLADATAQKFGFAAANNPTVNDVLSKVGDDLYPTPITGTLTAGATSVTLTDARITTNSELDIYTSNYSVQPYNVVASSGSVVLSFYPAATNVSIKVYVR